MRLETRAKEADVTLRQLKSYVQLLKQKAGIPWTLSLASQTLSGEERVFLSLVVQPMALRRGKIERVLNTKLCITLLLSQCKPAYVHIANVVSSIKMRARQLGYE